MDLLITSTDLLITSMDPTRPLPPAIYYIVWQILASKLVKVKRSGVRESTLYLQAMSITISSSKSLNTDIMGLKTLICGSNTRKTLQNLWKLLLRPAIL